MREAVGRPTSVTQLRDTRDSARRTFGLLEESVILQRSLFVRGAIGEFINGPLYDAFHDLVYSYRDEEWETAHRLVTGRFGDGELELFDASRVTANRAETWELLAAMNERLLEGSRRYHPAFFQGSEEERRLDQVLEYFNMVGSYWTRGLLKDEDLEPLDSYALLLVDRKAIAFYLAYSKEVWARRKEIRWREANIPFTHLRRLLVWAGGRRTQRENPQPDSETGPSQVRSAE